MVLVLGGGEFAPDGVMGTGMGNDAMLTEPSADGFRYSLDIGDGEITPGPGVALCTGMRNFLLAGGVAEEFLGSRVTRNAEHLFQVFHFSIQSLRSGADGPGSVREGAHDSGT